MNHVLLLHGIIFFCLFIRSTCYQMVYLDSFDKNNDPNEFNNLSCSWRYYCKEEFHFCEHGCSSKKKLKGGYNLLKTNNLRENCFINIECAHYHIFFDSEDPVYFIFFSKPFFRINRNFTLYVHLAKRNRLMQGEASGEVIHEKNRKGYTNWSILTMIWEKAKQYRNFISVRYKKSLIKLLIFLILIHMIFFYLYIYTYLHLKNHESL
ncbi:hypothetical protein, conserved [Plasmodium gonderi]|uniref:Uncharacterized protein n=1 Tax=Plasmodium gonderi TaxID=77519 RepID=A0A1Y1JHU3_PLAGO|nr:hypothetical protein, conserved [Plasmodium gonderi]GAW81810.1 hypothetical protein, conserved [Plasmodium gonderi]